ncbi:MAG TPA: 7-carboxy-7-deazaguanine synthase QueE, partial [Opitutales bacterium]|nr:7-carboxy-7-deazaguanine synthase QueE [Opitutales bacterium]
PVHCPWCDSAGTWHPDYVPEKIDRIEVDQLVAAAAATKAEFVVVTGGEPAIHDLRPLVEALHASGLAVHLETSGAFPIKGDFDWITLSPKRWKLPLADNLAAADEFKIIVDSTGAIEEYSAILPTPSDRPVWLHPEWSCRGNGDVLNAITDWVKTRGAPYRAGWQMHKPYQADTLDPKSAQAAPLGGDPEKGW